MINLTLQKFETLYPTVALTKLDECETTPAEFATLAGKPDRHPVEDKIGDRGGNVCVRKTSCCNIIYWKISQLVGIRKTLFCPQSK